MVHQLNVADAREHVAQLAREIEALVDAGGPPEAFFPEFLTRLVFALGAEAGAVWLRDGANRVNLACDVNLAGIGFFEYPDARRINDKLLGETLTSGQAGVHAPDCRGSEAPTRHVLLIGAVQKGKECVGVVEVFQRPDSPLENRPGYLQFIEHMCGHASRFLQNAEAAKTQLSPLDFWKQFERFLLDLQRTLDVGEVAGTAANDGRQLLQIDRASVAVRHGAATVMKSVSGAAEVNRRSNQVRLLEKLADRVIATSEPLLYTGQMEQLAPQIEEPLADYIHESGSRMVHVLPLFETEPPVVPGKKDENQSKKAVRRQAFGVYIIEQLSESRPRPGYMERAALVADHAAGALHNALIHENLFLLPVWRFLGRILEKLRGRTLYKVLAVVGVLLVTGIAMAIVPWDYRVEAKGRLMPSVQREVFAPWDGEVVEIFANSGDLVEKDQPLLRLRNQDLQAKRLAARNDLNEKQQLHFALQAQLDEAARKAARDEEIQLQGKLVQTGIEIEGAKEQVRLLEEQSMRLLVRSPIKGVVATFQLDQLLKNRPVQRGEVLLDVMNDKGAWRLELDVPEQRMGHVLRRQRAVGDALLPIEFLLATSTEMTFHGQLAESATKTDIGEEGSVVEIYATIAQDEFPKLKDNLRIGAEVRAKIDCGKRALGYVLFGDVVEFVQKRILLW